MKHASNVPRAIMLFLIAMAIIPTIDVFAKFLGQQHFHVFQLVWARFFFGALAMLPFALKVQGKRAVWPEHPRLQALRAAMLLTSTTGFFGALQFLPIADTLAIYFVSPILVTALSPFVLGEYVGPRRWLMVFIGFIGVLIIIRPGLNQINAGIGLALGSGLVTAFYMLLTRRMTGKVDAMVSSYQTCLLGAIPTTAALFFFWTPPNTSQWAMLFGIGAIASFCHFLIARAYDFGEASLLSPLAYTEMIMAVTFGWWFFGDFPDFWTILGAAILMACSIYISLREGKSSPPDLNHTGTGLT